MLPLDFARHIVTAVVVTHDGARWLPETLDAIRAQTRPVQRIIGVDTGSRDRSGDILAEYINSELILSLPRTTGYGEAIQAAIDHPRSRSQLANADGTVEWIWLIHDDCAPAPDTLAQLLAAADEDPRAAVLGPKLRDWFDRRLLLEAGVTIDGAGRRETGLEYAEVDHGQHDGTRQVLAVSSACMLIRRDVWEELGGFDRSLRLFRDDIDFCWRVGGAGYRVLIVTDTVAYHAEAAARRRRHIHATSDHPRRIDRRNALYVLLANLPLGAMLAALVRNSFASALRVLTYLVAKQPANAFDEAAAITSVFFVMPFRLVRARIRRRQGRRRTYSAIRPFMARGVALRQFTEAVANLLSGDPTSLDRPGRHQAVTVAPQADEDDDPLQDDTGLLRRTITNPAVLTITALTVVSLIAGRSLLLGDRLAGGVLPPVWGSASDLWDMYLAGWHDVGVGSDAAAPPYLAVLAALSTLTLGKPWLAIIGILLGCVPLAGFTAYQLARRVVPYRPAQLWMAASYALLPVATGAIAQGRVGTALVHALFPVLGLLVTRVLTLNPRRSRRSAWALGLLLALLTAFVPLVWVLALITGVLIAIAFGHLGRRLQVSLAISLITPLVLLLPWTLELIRRPWLWLMEAGINRSDIVNPQLSAEALLLLSPGGPGTPPLWVTGGFIAAALCALLLRRNRILVAAGWCVALLGILIAIVVSRLPLSLSTTTDSTAWPGVVLAFASTAMLLSAATAARSFSDLWRLGGYRRLFAATVALLALTTPVSAAGLWMWHGVEGPLTGNAPPSIPPFLESVSADGTQPRTLVLSPRKDGVVSYTVLRGQPPRLGEPQITPDSTVNTRLGEVVAAMAAGRGGDDAAALAQFGIRFLMVPAPSIGDAVDRTLVDTIDALPGVERLQLTEEFALWRLLEETGRLRIVGPGEDTEPIVLESGPLDAQVTIPPGPEGRRLLLAEPARDDWEATLDGRVLAGATTEWGTQEFSLPAEGGTLVLTYTGVARQVWLTIQAILLVVVGALALPGVKTEEDLREQAAQPALRPRRPQRLRRAVEGTRQAGRGRHGRRHNRQRGEGAK